MKAIILAAGRGSRMKRLTDDFPKCLLEVQGRSLLEWQISALLQAGVDEIAIVTGYKRELLIKRGLKEFYNLRWFETNMVSSLACAREWLLKEACIVSYSDIFYDSSAVIGLLNTKANIAITYDPNWLRLWRQRFEDPLVDAETFRIDVDGTLLEIGGKPSTIEEIQGQYMGLLKISPQGWSEIERIRGDLPKHQQDNIHVTGILQKVIDGKNMSITCLPYVGRWGEVDNENDLSSYN